MLDLWQSMVPTTNSWTKSSSECCSQLNLPKLTLRHQFFSVCFLHDVYHHHTSVNFNCKFNSIPSTRSHHLSINPPQSTNNCLHYSFFVNTIFLWHSVPLMIQTKNPSSIHCINICVWIDIFVSVLRLV